MPHPADADDNEADRAFNAAKDLARAGKYAEALERREWYHENALRIDPAQSGVRLSFAIAYWKDLADQYPPALASLKAIRDAGVRELEAGTGDHETFAEVHAINGALEEDRATIELFKFLAAGQPALARQCFVCIEDTLIDEGEVELFAKHGGDLVKRLKRQFILHRATVSVIKSMPADALPAYTSAAERIKGFEEDVVETALKLIGAADKQGDSATANRLKTLAFRRFPDPRLQP